MSPSNFSPGGGGKIVKVESHPGIVSPNAPSSVDTSVSLAPSGFGLIQSAAAARAAWILLGGGNTGTGSGGSLMGSGHPGHHALLGGGGLTPNSGFFPGTPPGLGGSTASTYWRM